MIINKQKKPTNELFENNQEYYDKKYNSDQSSYVQYSKDYSEFKLKLAQGYFKIENSQKLTIRLEETDYREAPFDTKENLKACLEKWGYFEYDGNKYKTVIYLRGIIIHGS